MLRFVRMRSSHARRFVPGVNERHERNALAYVSWTRSSASSFDPTMWRATRYTWSASSSASSSKRTRARESEASLRAELSAASVKVVATIDARTGGGARLFPASGNPGELAEAAARERVEQRLARRALVVPREPHLAEQVRGRVEQPVVPLEDAAEPHDALLAADAGHLDRLGVHRHATILPVAARRLSARGSRARAARRPPTRSRRRSGRTTARSRRRGGCGRPPSRAGRGAGGSGRRAPPRRGSGGPRS